MILFIFKCLANKKSKFLQNYDFDNWSELVNNFE
jgi:DNA replication protein DnaC